MSRRATRSARLTVTLLFVISSLQVAIPTPSGAATRTSPAHVRAAKSALDNLNHQLEVAGEQYNAANVSLGLAQAKLAAAHTAMQAAQAQADAATSELSQRAADAYMGAGSQVGVLLGAESYADFSDGLEFIGTLAQSDADLATKEEAATQQYKWATEQYQAAVAERQNELNQITQTRAAIRKLVAQASTIYRQTTSDRAKWVAYERAQRAAAQRLAAEQSAAAAAAASGGGGSTTGGSGGYIPPPNATAAEIAIGAAKSVLGAPYVFAAADPSVGFDCSGLTMWAWAQTGVSLPHNAAMQYDALPHVPLDQIQPGDLLFFYTPISHVAMYLGDGMIIHATHPGAGGGVHIEPLGSVWTPLLVGAARPG